MTEENVHIDYGKTTKYYHVKVAHVAAEFMAGKSKVLDYGCGVGHTLAILQKLRPSARLFCCDAFQECLRITKARADIEGAYLVKENEFGTQGIGEDYDMILLSHVLEHTKRPVDNLTELMRLLKPGGVLVVAVPNVLTPFNFLRIALRRLSTNEGHVVAWDLGHWRNMLVNIGGFDVVRWDHDEAFIFPRFIPINTPLKWFERCIAWLVPGWSFSHIAVIRKSSLG